MRGKEKNLCAFSWSSSKTLGYPSPIRSQWLGRAMLQLRCFPHLYLLCPSTIAAFCWSSLLFPTFLVQSKGKQMLYTKEELDWFRFEKRQKYLYVHNYFKGPLHPLWDAETLILWWFSHLLIPPPHPWPLLILILICLCIFHSYWYSIPDVRVGVTLETVQKYSSLGIKSSMEKYGIYLPEYELPEEHKAMLNSSVVLSPFH